MQVVVHGAAIIRPRVIKAPITFSCILSEEERWITLVMLAMLDATGDLLAEDELHWMWSCAGAAERRICGGAVVLMLSSSSRVHTWRRSSRHGVLQERIMPNRTTPRTWPWIKLLHPGAGACDVRRGEAI
ncbi:uncharacterized protein [Aegilops tauschii subsp. strangulata]|uniref:uncharacterized protein n=1 Tax=Aegilops tauschii subsp. strangulata TaxID=200361 RepID=UPI001ABC850F|nr:uncharacterized protein LOC109757950 isoform X1 [Aegilops tauschii subsp. strangulata]